MGNNKKKAHIRIDGKQIAPRSIRWFHLHDSLIQQLLTIFTTTQQKKIREIIVYSGDRVYGEEPEYQGNRTYKLQHPFVPGSLEVFIQGVKMPTRDIESIDPANGTFTINNSYPDSSDLFIEANYNKAIAAQE